MNLVLLVFLASMSVLGQTHTPAECKTPNQFLCQTQCGKVLIQCTGAGVGVALPPLDEDAAVCNNGAIDFATNCQTTTGSLTSPAPAPALVPVPAPVPVPVPAPAPAPVLAPQLIPAPATPAENVTNAARIAFLAANQQNGGKNALVPLTNPLVQPPTPPTRTGEQICAQLKTQGVPEVPNEGLFFCVDLFRFARCHNGKVIINQFMQFDTNPLVRQCSNDNGFCAGQPGPNPCVTDAAAAVAASKNVEYFLLPTKGVLFSQA
ncbi:UNVERIFIED_CONTAM: hypothetical protein HDU68_009833 [Siphonaria sp. JEL0065]|nr:hypothetical protein HDU68_009833 [Siphonaria sp. JEL0065]